MILVEGGFFPICVSIWVCYFSFFKTQSSCSSLILVFILHSSFTTHMVFCISWIYGEFSLSDP